MTMLVVYYSLSGNTRAIARALASALGADLEELRCSRYSRSPWGALRAGYDSWRGRLPAIGPLAHDPTHYDLVVLGGPIWAFHPSTPIRAFLRQQAPRLSNLAFFLTHGGSAGEQSLRVLAQLAGREPRATLLVREPDIKAGRFGQAVSGFATKLRAPVAAAPRKAAEQAA